MKNRVITGILFILLGAFLAFGPISIFPVCGANTIENKSGKVKENADGAMNMGGDNSDSGKEDNTDSSMAMGKSMVMTCHWTARAELGVGILIIIIGVLLIVLKSVAIRLGLNLTLVLNGVLAFLIPNYLIGVCESVHMYCHSLTLPALSVLSAIVVFAGIINSIYLHKINSKG